MKHKNLLRVCLIITLCLVLVLPALAAGTQDDLRVETGETTGGETTGSDTASGGATARVTYSLVPTLSSSDQVLSLIKKYEGFYAEPYQDTEWTAIGYGTRYSDAQAKYPGCTSITQEQALALVRDELDKIDASLNSFLKSNGIVLNQNQFDALADFTYNVGIGWTTYKNDDGTWCMLKVMLLDGSSAWTSDRVSACFGTWVYAGGVKLQGLVRRRAEEAALFVKAGAFSDVTADKWYYTPVTQAYELGLMRGCGDGTFAPEAQMTRAQLVQALANFSGTDLTTYSGTRFSDVKSSEWYAPTVEWAAETGIVNGVGDGLFSPDTAVSRQQVCSILARYLRSIGVTLDCCKVQTFEDDALIGDYYRDDVYFCASLGLMSGVGSNCFDPQSPTTRAQVAKILVNMKALVTG